MGGTAYNFSIPVTNAGDVPTSGTVTVTDEVDPTQFSSVNSVGGDGWTCTPAGFDVTCTRSDPLAPGATYPPIVINATVEDPVPATVINTANVSGGGDVEDSNNSATDAGGAVAQADLSITKSEDINIVPARGEVAYTLEVENRGPSTAPGVTVTDTLAPNFTAIEVTPSQGTCTDAVVCTLGSLAPGQRATITIFTRVEDAAVDSTVVNTAAVDVTGANVDDPFPDNNVGTADIDVPVSSDLQVVKSFSPAPNPTAGDPVTFTIPVTNAGPSLAQNVIVEDVLPAEYYALTPVPTGTITGAGNSCDFLAASRQLSCTIPTLAVNETETITITATLRPDSRGKTVLNSVKAISDSLDPNPELAQDTISFVPIPAADLEITKVGPGDPVTPGGVGTFIFQIANRGPSNAPDVVVRDRLPDGLSLVSVPSGCTVTGQDIICQLGQLDAGTAFEIPIEVLVDPVLAGWTVRNAATIGSEADPLIRPAEVVPSSNSDAADLVVGPLPPEPPPPEPPTPPTPPAPPSGPPPSGPLSRLVIEKSVLGAGARVGDELVWTVRVRNTGAGPARDVVVTDTPGRGVSPRSAQPSAGSCAGSAPVTCRLGDIAPGATAEVILRTRATRPGTLANAATVASPSTQAPGAVLSARSTARVRGADVRLAKVASRTSLTRGDRVQFTLTARSRARSTVSGVRVCDRLPEGLAFVSAPGARYRNGQACWTLRLRAGQTRRLTVTTRAASLPRTRRVRNLAALRGDTVAGRTARADVTVRGRRGRGGGVTG